MMMRTVVLSLAAIVLLTAAVPAAAYTPSQALYYKPLGKDGSSDLFYNYDGEMNYRKADRDWPIGLIFHDNATVSKVKQMYDDDQYAVGGGRKWLPYKDPQYDADRQRMDTDKGVKTPCDSRGLNEHFRIYGNVAGQRFYSQSYGYFVVASAHYDHGDGECPGEQWFGFSERVEEIIVDLARSDGYAVRPNHVGMRNREKTREEDGAGGRHFWQNSGMASTIRVP